MDTLTINLKLHSHDEPEDYLVTEVAINGQPIVDFGKYAIDLYELMKSKQSNGSFFIITCWCGDAGCAGISHGIKVEHRDGKVFWVVSEPEPKRNLVFQQDAYQQAMEGFFKNARKKLGYFQTTHSKKLNIVPERNATLLHKTSNS